MNSLQHGNHQLFTVLYSNMQPQSVSSLAEGAGREDKASTVVHCGPAVATGRVEGGLRG